MPFPVFDKPARRPLAPTPPDPHVFVDHLGDALPVFLHKDLPARDALAHLVAQHGGELAPTMRHAVYLIVDPQSSDGQDTIDGYGDRPDKRVLRPEWLHLCVAAGRLVIANDWAGCRLGRTPVPRKRPADDTPDAAAKQPRTDPMPAPVSYTYTPAYPLVPGYYPPNQPYPYYEPPPQPAPPPIKKRNPRPPRQPNRPWTLEENVALYNFMAQNPAPTEREQATLVRRWAKETRPDRGRQSWVAHAFATSFKNWVKEYEAGNVNANPADFSNGQDADAEAEADPDHDASPELSQSGTSAASDFQPGQFTAASQAPPGQLAYNPAAAGPAQYPTGFPTPAQYSTPPNSNQSYTSPTQASYTSPPSSAQTQAQYTSPPTSAQPQYTSPQSSTPLQFPSTTTPTFAQFNEPQHQQIPEPKEGKEENGEPSSDPAGAGVVGPGVAVGATVAVGAAVTNGAGANPAGFPPIYPMVYPTAAAPSADTTEVEPTKENGAQ